MQAADAYNLYKQQDIATSNPREIVSKLYSSAVVNLRRAILDIDNKRIESAHNNIVRTKKIIAALDGSLDFNFDISNQMHQLYIYMMHRLHEANMKKDTEILTEVSGMLSKLRDAWDEARKIAK